MAYVTFKYTGRGGHQGRGSIVGDSLGERETIGWVYGRYP